MRERPTDRGADARFEALPDDKPPLWEVRDEFSFVTVRRHAGLVWLAGHVPFLPLKQRPPSFITGKIGPDGDLTKEDGQKAARLVGLNLLVSLRKALGSLDHVGTVLQVVGEVNSAPGFSDQSFVMNGCTNLMVEVFGEAGRPTRMALGASELPFQVAVEASMVVSIRTESAKCS